MEEYSEGARIGGEEYKWRGGFQIYFGEFGGAGLGNLPTEGIIHLTNHCLILTRNVDLMYGKMKRPRKNYNKRKKGGSVKKKVILFYFLI